MYKAIIDVTSTMDSDDLIFISCTSNSHVHQIYSHNIYIYYYYSVTCMLENLGEGLSRVRGVCVPLVTISKNLGTIF
jgi:hypothetical protein